MEKSVHINAEKGDFAKVVLMPGDPLRAKYIAETFLDDVKLVTSVRNMLGYTGYYKGKSVTALLSNDKLYAKVEGIKSTSPVAIVYFVFLFGTFGMIMLSATYMSKSKAKKQEI